MSSNADGAIKFNKVKYNTKEIIVKFLNFYKQIPNDFFSKIVFSLDCFDQLYLNKIINSEENIYISFNGGKDCLAAFILVKYYFYCKDNKIQYSELNSFIKFSKYCSLNKSKQIFESDNNSNYNYLSKLKLVYFVSIKNFLEEEDYVIKFNNSEIIDTFYLVTDYISGLNYLIKNFSVRLIILGTRKDDLINYKINNLIDVEKTLIHESTAPYPNFLRFYPIFNFTFEEIWRLILFTDHDYMNLYDKGYSSIGKRDNTQINKNLIIEDEGILPAWCLGVNEYITERSFRNDS